MIVYDLSQWLNGAPVILSGDSTFSTWLDGAPVVEQGESEDLPFNYARSRIVSPREPLANTTAFHRRVSPRIARSRQPI